MKENVLELLKRLLFFDVFPFLCRLLSAVFLVPALHAIGFPPKQEIGTLPLTLFVFSIFLLLLPIAKKISLGKLITFEREIEKVREDVTDFKAETREFLNVYSNMITAISNTVSQTVNVHLPGQAEAQQAKEELYSTIGDAEPSSVQDEVDNYLALAGEDLNFALAKLRMDLERKLRELLDKRTSTLDPTSMMGRFMSARQLFKEFTEKYPNYKAMHSSFDYILKVCNAAIHGQQIFDGHGREALYMGVTMLRELNRISGDKF